MSTSQKMFLIGAALWILGGAFIIYAAHLDELETAAKLDQIRHDALERMLP